MNMFQRFRHPALFFIGALLLCIASIALADELEDASKLYRQGQHAEALRKTDAYLTNKPQDAQARFLKALILTDQNKIAEAIKLFSGLTEDYPELPEPYNNLAVLYASQGEYDKAKESLEMAIRTHPSYSTAHENLGDIYAKMASQAYNRALQLDSGNTATQTKLSMIQDLFDRKKQKETALAHEAPAVALPVSKPPAITTKQLPEQVKPLPIFAAEKDNVSSNPDEILKTVDAWAAAWSSQKVDDYLSFYADDFKTNKGQSLDDWKTYRTDRVSTPKFIKVRTGKATVKFDDTDHATVKFRQNYHANHLKSENNKTLKMVRKDGKWLIQEEISK